MHGFGGQVKALVVGLGGIGRRHTRNLKGIDPDIRVLAWRRSSETADLGPLSLLIEGVVSSKDEALAWQPDVAIVATPTAMHMESALLLAREGVHLFIEKPLSDRLDSGLEFLLSLCRNKSLVLMVGYSLRFDPSLQAIRQAVLEGRIGRPLSMRAEVGQFLPDWRPGLDYRKAVSAQRSLGGGAVLELSHEIDYARWLMGEVRSVGARLARLSDLEINVEDIAEITLEFDTGALGSIHLDMVQRDPIRGCRIIGTEGTLAWDGITHTARLFTASSGRWTALLPSSPDRDSMYVNEIRHFLECATGRCTPTVSGEEGRRVLEIALAARRSSEEGRVLSV